MARPIRNRDFIAKSQTAMVCLMVVCGCEQGDGDCGYLFAGIASMEDGVRADEVGAQAFVELGPCRIDVDVYCEFEQPMIGTYELIVTAPGYGTEYREVRIDPLDGGSCQTTSYDERIIVGRDAGYAGPLLRDDIGSAADDATACVLANVDVDSVLGVDPQVAPSPAFLDVYIAFGRATGQLRVVDDFGFGVADGAVIEAFTEEVYWSQSDGEPYGDPRWDSPASGFVPERGIPSSGNQRLFFLSGAMGSWELIWQADVRDSAVSGAGTRSGSDLPLRDVLAACG